MFGTTYGAWRSAATVHFEPIGIEAFFDMIVCCYAGAFFCQTFVDRRCAGTAVGKNIYFEYLVARSVDSFGNSVQLCFVFVGQCRISACVQQNLRLFLSGLGGFRCRFAVLQLLFQSGVFAF